MHYSLFIYVKPHPILLLTTEPIPSGDFYLYLETKNLYGLIYKNLDN